MTNQTGWAGWIGWTGQKSQNSLNCSFYSSQSIAHIMYFFVLIKIIITTFYIIAHALPSSEWFVKPLSRQIRTVDWIVKPLNQLKCWTYLINLVWEVYPLQSVCFDGLHGLSFLKFQGLLKPHAPQNLGSEAKMQQSLYSKPTF